jgi:hypothetical protein
MPMKMPDKIDQKMFAPCGMNCMVCYVHLKNKKPCGGCMNSDINKPERCRLCKIKICAHEKQLRYCLECPDFPCLQIKNLDKSYRKRYGVSLIENSRGVSAEGFEFFFLKEKSRWSCTECGDIISLHDKECTGCGKKY